MPGNKKVRRFGKMLHNELSTYLKHRISYSERLSSFDGIAAAHSATGQFEEILCQFKTKLISA